MNIIISVLPCIVLSGSMSLPFVLANSRSYVLVKSSNGSAVCAVDTPTKVIPMMGSRITKKMKCGAECTAAQSCRFYQVKEDLDQCELYAYAYNWPTTYKVIQHCTAYRTGK